MIWHGTFRMEGQRINHQKLKVFHLFCEIFKYSKCRFGHHIESDLCGFWVRTSGWRFARRIFWVEPFLPQVSLFCPWLRWFSWVPMTPAAPHCVSLWTSRKAFNKVKKKLNLSNCTVLRSPPMCKCHVNGRLSLYVVSVMNRRPVLGVPRLLPQCQLGLAPPPGDAQRINSTDNERMDGAIWGTLIHTLLRLGVRCYLANISMLTR